MQILVFKVQILLLHATEKNTQIITQERGLQDILLALENHGQCKDVADAACSALWSLSMEGKRNDIQMSQSY